MMRQGLARTARALRTRCGPVAGGQRRGLHAAAARRAEVEITIDGKKVMIEQVRRGSMELGLAGSMRC